MKNKVSVVIPCFNQAEFLAEAIESAMSQSHQNPEIIVVNDGSEDMTSLVALQYPVKLITQANKGLSAARNTGIKVASGEYILTLDADDKIAPDFIEKTIGKNDIVSTYRQEFGLKNKVWMNPNLNPTHQNFKLSNQIPSCALFKKEVWEKIGGYDEKMKDGFEDWEFWIRATAAGYKVSIIPEALFFYRKHGFSMVDHAINNQMKIREYMKIKGSL